MHRTRHLRAVNLNLLPVLRELLRKRNVTHAAEALFMSQSAVSEALGRLRHLLQDDILVARGRQFVPTPLAERLGPMLETSLDQIELLLSTPQFDPAQIKGSVKIATVDYVVAILGAELLQRLRARAPDLTVHFIDVTPQSAADLGQGELDFIWSPATPLLIDHERLPLFDDAAVCIVPADSPITGTISEADFWSARHAAFAPGSVASASLHASVLAHLGKEEFNAVLVQNFLLLSLLVESTNTIAIVPRLLAEQFSLAANVRIVDLPFNFPEIRISAYWSRGRTHDPAHQWFRDLLTELTAARVKSQG